MIIRPFNAAHLLLLALAAGAVVLLWVLLRGQPERCRSAVLIALCAANIIGFFVYKGFLSRDMQFLQASGLDRFNWFSELPMQLCNINMFLIPIGILVGYFIVKAEPAVQVLNNQVEDITGGTISHGMMNSALSIGVAAAVALAMVRVLTGLNIYWILIPGYAAALILSRFVPQIFVGIAYDSGGVASGPMTATFLLPFAQGACSALGGDIMTDAFGIVAMVAMTPLITIQMLGLLYQYRLKKNGTSGEQTAPADDDIIEL